MTDNKQPGFKVVIPARFASSRLPGKPLLDLGGKPMVVRVAERARESGAEEVIVACDHPDVLAAVEQHGFVARLTRPDHPSGTDRLAEIVEREGWGDETLVVNVQGDEPLIDPALIARLAGRLAGLSKDEASIVTAAYPVQSAADFFSPNVVKVVCAESGRALYFSRAPVPWARDAFAIDTGRQQPSPGSLHHIGIYAYRCHFLKVYSTLSPSPLEQIESLEQLRALAHGFNIHVIREAAAPMAGVDTPEDALRIKQWFDQEAEYR